MERKHARHPVLSAILVTALALLAASFPVTPAAAWTVPPAPTLINVNPTANEGDYLIGAIPPNYDPSKPVIVFVQGLHGSAQNWWGPTTYYGDNDMYAYAYNYGYRTAFVQFRDADGNAGSMWLNGSVLRTQLEAICRYFGVSKVNIVAHSKGGVDSQSAIVHYGAYPYVQNVFTLASPHRGSQLADLCYSWWSWWLAALLGQRDDGTYVMQTSYMDYFRSITNNRPEDANIRYYTGAGTDWGPWFSAMWFGGNYLWWYDDNDGVVCLYSAHGLPNGTRVFTDGSLNHDNIRMGSKSWKYISPYLSYYRASSTETVLASSSSAAQRGLAGAVVATVADAGLIVVDGAGGGGGATPSPDPSVPLDALVRGGPVEGAARTEFAVESGVGSLAVNCLVGNPATIGSLVAPDGTRTALAALPEYLSGAPEFFAGASVLGATIDHPAAGTWALELTSPAGDAYLATVGFGGGAAVKLPYPLAKVYAPGDTVSLSLEARGSDGAALPGLAVNGVAVATEPGKGKLGASPDYGLTAKFRIEPSSSLPGHYAGGFKLPGREGVYNLTIDLAGTQADGTSLNRTLVLSILVLKPEHRNVEGLQGLPVK